MGLTPHSGLPLFAVVFLMTQQAYQSQVLSIAQADHEILECGIQNLRRLFMGIDPPAVAALASIPKFIDKQVRHFAYAEKQVFPLLVVDNPGENLAQVVAELRQEQATLLEELRWLKNLLQRYCQTRFTDELRTATLDFFATLEKHSAKEAQLFALFN